MIVWLASFPRSGNTYFRIALEKLYGQKSLSLYEDDPDRIRQDLAALRQSCDVHFIKTHELPNDDSPAILLVRDGRDAMVSFAHYINDYEMVQRSGFNAILARAVACKERVVNGRNRFEQSLRRVITGEYFNWSKHYQAWRNRRASCAVVNFETLIARPGDVVQQSLEALGIALEKSGENVPPFEVLHAQDPKFYRAGTTGQWCREMRPELEELFWQEHRDAMLHAGYRR